jgi:hypothetical protein
MCDERERLIDFVYGEGDAGARREFEQHLGTCGACRDEVSAFGRVRTDLLAWDVPEHGSVWKPFAPARTTPWWREVPAWAMAAAATAVFAIGAAGGAATRAVIARPAAVSTRAGAQITAAAVQSVPAGVSRADLDAFRSQLVDTMRTEMDSRVRLVSTHATTSSPDSDRALQLVRAQVQTGDQRDNEIFNAVRSLNNDVVMIKANQDSRIEMLKQRIDQLQAALAAMSAAQQPGGKQ